MTSVAKHFLTENHLKAIGLVVAEWSYTELFLEYLIWEIAQLDDYQGPAITTHLASETRIHILETLADTGLHNKTHKTELKDIVNRLRDLRTKRNNIVHAIWLSSKPLAPITLLTSKKRKSIPASIRVKAKGKINITRVPFTSKEILSVASEITHLGSNMTDLVAKIQKDREGREAVAKALLARRTPAQSPDPKTTKPQA